jgi:hypothetical protein
MMSHSPAAMRTTPEINVARISELSEKVLSGTKVTEYSGQIADTFALGCLVTSPPELRNERCRFLVLDLLRDDARHYCTHVGLSTSTGLARVHVFIKDQVVHDITES